MNAEIFCDSNVWVYAVSGDPAESAKKRRALEIIQSERIGISAQVLQEFYVIVTRKIAKPLAPAEALKWIEQMEQFPLVNSDAALVKLGIENSVKHRISFWDGAIVAGAERLGCAVLYSEDLNDRQRFGCLRVVNPFK